MTIRLGYSAQRGNFFIEMNDALMLCDGGFNVEDTLELDDYIELIFESNLPIESEVSNEHDLIRYDYSVMIHQSLIHCGEDEPAIFSTTERSIMEHITANVQAGRITTLRLKKRNHREHYWYVLDFGPFQKGLRVYDPQSDS